MGGPAIPIIKSLMVCSQKRRSTLLPRYVPIQGALKAVPVLGWPALRSTAGEVEGRISFSQSANVCIHVTFSPTPYPAVLEPPVTPMIMGLGRKKACQNIWAVRALFGADHVAFDKLEFPHRARISACCRDNFSAVCWADHGCLGFTWKVGLANVIVGTPV